MPASRTVRRRARWGVMLVAILALCSLADTAYALPDTGLSSSPAPWIASDQSDYAPGSTVHLTGGGWQPGEAVQIFTYDSVGNTWSRTENVTADSSGLVADDVVLPNTFVANYAVTATGAQSGTATTTFTDSQ